jgi:YihY family inner membrane protein
MNEPMLHAVERWPAEARPFAKRVLRRFRDADGSSHARSLSFASMFVLLSGFIGLLGLASAANLRSLRGVVQQLARTLSPGPSGKLLEEAARQGVGAGPTALIFGLIAALVAATLAMAQIERSANRLVGVDRDRPTAERYVTALMLALSAGTLTVVGALILAAGPAISSGFRLEGGASTAWAIVRWPIGIAILALGLLVVFRAAPRVELGTPRQRLAGVVAAVVLWVIFTLLLALYLSMSSSSKTYGPLLSIIGLLLWTGLGSLALHLGLAVTAELADAPSPARGTVLVPEAEATLREPLALAPDIREPLIPEPVVTDQTTTELQPQPAGSDAYVTIPRE